MGAWGNGAPSQEGKARKNPIARPTELAALLMAQYVRPGDTVVDATVGNGWDTVALARLARGGRVYGFDIQREALERAEVRLREAGCPVAWRAEGVPGLRDGAPGETTEAFGVQGAAPRLDGAPGETTEAFRVQGEALCLDGAPGESTEAFRAQGEALCLDGAPGERPGNEAAACGETLLICADHRRMAEYVCGQAAAVVFNLGYLPGGDKKITTRADSTCEAMRSALSLLRPGGALIVTIYGGHPAGKAEREAVLRLAGELPAEEYHTLHARLTNQGEGAPEVLAVVKRGIHR